MSGSRKKAPPTKRAPQQQRALDRVEAILAATEAAIAEGGYDNLTMVNIAARAGITHTSIYHYFTSVEAILIRLISRLMADFDREVEVMVAKADTPAELVEAVLESIGLAFDLYRTRPVARGLTAATRYLPTLRKLDDEDNVRIARLFRDRFVELAPAIDRNAIYVLMMMSASLAVPAYETALSLPKRLQRPAVNDFLAMVRSRFSVVVPSQGG